MLTALIDRQKTGKGQKFTVSMQEVVLDLCRVKLRDQQRLERVGYLEEYPQYPIRADGKYGRFGDAVPRGGNAGGGGQPGWVLKCKGWEKDPNSYIYFTIQDTNWVRTCAGDRQTRSGQHDPAYATPEARQPHIFDIFAEIEKWLADKTKYEAVNILRKYEVPCAPVFDMKEIEHDPDLRTNGTIVEVPHKVRGSYLTIGSVMKFSDFTPKITASPLLGEHTDEVLASLGYSACKRSPSSMRPKWSTQRLRLRKGRRKPRLRTRRNKRTQQDTGPRTAAANNRCGGPATDWKRRSSCRQNPKPRP